MKVVYTDQSLDSLEESLRFLIEEQGISLEKVGPIKEQLFERAKSLVQNPYKGQYEEYLQHLDQGHRRLVEWHFKIIYITDFFDTRQDPAKMKSQALPELSMIQTSFNNQLVVIPDGLVHVRYL